MNAVSSTATNYLTVQDILWLNSELTKKSHPFDYAILEEATFYQYGYGVSNEIQSLAGRFLTGFMKKPVFGHGDAATAFAGFVAFLMLNGYELDLPDTEAVAWVNRVRSGEIKADEAVSKLSHLTAGHHEGDARNCMALAIELYPKTLEALL
ncbi:MAG: hypothetical protein ABL949_08115 [Fimbriimonadaceae bacterium]